MQNLALLFDRSEHKDCILFFDEAALPEGFTYAGNISFDKLSNYELTGANVSNILKYCCVEATVKGSDEIKLVSNKSGHYRPSGSLVEQFIQELKARGVKGTESITRDFVK